MIKTLYALLKATEEQTFIYKTVLEKFPDAKYFIDAKKKIRFNSKLVNSIYTDVAFEANYGSLHVLPYYDLEVVYNDKSSFIKIYASPRRSRLAYIAYDNVTNRRQIKFGKMAVNFKNNKFKEEMMNSCRIQIMNFISTNKDCTLNTTHLDPRLKKLMAFS